MRTGIIGLIIGIALLLLPGGLFATENQVALCSQCQTGCYLTYSQNLDDCSWRWWCADLATSEKNACLGNCAIDVC